MYVTAVSPYGSSQSVNNRLSFEGKEKTGFMSDVGKTAAKAGKKPGVMSSIRKAMIGTMIGAATLVGGKAMAQAQGPDNVKATTVALAGTKEVPVFASDTFDIGMNRYLVLDVVNKQGDKNSFDAIIGELHDNYTKTIKRGEVIAIWDTPYENWNRFLFAHYDNAKDTDVVDKKAFEWVKKFVNNTKRNKSDIIINKDFGKELAETAVSTVRTIAKAVK